MIKLKYDVKDKINFIIYLKFKQSNELYKDFTFLSVFVRDIHSLIYLHFLVFSIDVEFYKVFLFHPTTKLFFFHPKSFPIISSSFQTGLRQL